MMPDLASDREVDTGEPSAASSARWDVRETRIRLPRRVVHELKRVADANGTTMNGLIACYIDAGLRAGGRRGIHELAPWFSTYLRRKGGRGRLADRTIDTGEDFT